MANYEIIKRVCSECSINFNSDLMICKNCEPARYRFCFMNRGVLK
jgi:hypothetical protein